MDKSAMEKTRDGRLHDPSLEGALIIKPMYGEADVSKQGLKGSRASGLRRKSPSKAILA